MPVETAIATPFESDEIIAIAVEEFRKRLRGLSPLYSGKEYTAFALNFNVTLRLDQVSGEKINTLAWGDGTRGTVASPEEHKVVDGEFVSGEPNAERMERGMEMTVQGRNGTRRKVHIKDAGKASLTDAMAAHPSIKLSDTDILNGVDGDI